MGGKTMKNSYFVPSVPRMFQACSKRKLLILNVVPSVPSKTLKIAIVRVRARAIYYVSILFNYYKHSPQFQKHLEHLEHLEHR